MTIRRDEMGAVIATLRAQLAEAQTERDRERDRAVGLAARVIVYDQYLATIEQIAQGLADALRGDGPLGPALAKFDAYQKQKGK